VNRIGTDGTGIAHNGQSLLIDAKGRELAKVNENGLDLNESIDSKPLLEYRELFPVLNDADGFRFF
jgi:omega-amidase